MKIQDLWLTHFGKFHSRHIALNPGMNVVEGNNEAGKSTIHSFIFAMLFGLDGSPEARILKKQYEPWENRGGYCGALKFSEGGREYIIERGFSDDAPYVHLTEVSSGREIIPAQEKIKELLGGITEAVFLNTVSIGQMKSVSVPELATELKEHVNNLGSAKNLNISLQKAQDSLNARRRRLERKLVPDAKKDADELSGLLTAANDELNRNLARYTELSSKLSEGKNQEFDEYSSKQNKYDELKKRSEGLETEKNRLVAEIERYEQEKGSVLESAGKNSKLSEALDKNKLPGLPFSGHLGIICIVLGILLAGGAGYAFYSRYLKRSMLIFAIIGVVVLLVAGIIGLILSEKKKKKRRNYYRLALDKISKLTEAQRALASVSDSHAKCLLELTELDRSEFITLHRKNEELEKELLKLEYEQAGCVNNIKDINEKLVRKKRQVANNEHIMKEIAAIRLSLAVMFSAAQEIENSFGDKMLEAAGRYFNKITLGAYDEIIIGPDHKPILRQGDRNVDINSVSRGTIEQAYLCIRLAASECMTDVNMPLLLDDTFAFFDDDRTKSSLDLLKDCSHQVLVMTCQKREKVLLKI